MNYIFFFMSATFIVLIAGLIVMAIGGKINRKYSSALMSYRVIFQALAVSLILVLYMLRK